MNHSDIQRHMPDYLEGDLDLERRALVDAHLDECVDCAREVAGFRSTIEALRRLPEPVVPADLAANVMRRIRMGEGRTSLVDRIRAFGSELFAPRILAPASMALLAAGLILGTGDLRFGLDQIGDGLALGPATITGIAPAAHDVPAQVSVRPERTPVFVTSSAPSTQGQELLALSQLMDERSAIRSRFNDWPVLQPASVSHVALNPVGPVVERSTSRFLPDPVMGAGQRWPSADEWLVQVQQRPSEFADLMALRTLAEQEHWIDSLARRALAKGELDEIVLALRSSGSERARILAEDFASISSSSSGSELRPTNDRRD